jgi:hypothetical protein
MNDDDTPDTNEQQESETSAPLQNTVWNWSTVTLKFVDATQAQLAGDTLAYTYNETTRAGAIVTVGEFTTNEDWAALTFASYKGGAARTFNNSNSSMIGSKWYFGAAELEFLSSRYIRIHGKEYTYTYNPENRSGAISGDISNNSATYDGISQGDVINALGPFTLAADTLSLTFSNYRNSTFTATFLKDADPGAAGTLTGSAWYWPSLVLEFLPNGKALMYSFTGYYPHPHIYPYNYDSGEKTGSFGTAERVCAYSSSTLSIGSFEIKENFDTGDGTIALFDLYFSNYKSYGHRADFVKMP